MNGLSFTVRIELYETASTPKLSSQIYEALHLAMEAVNFSRIINIAGKPYKLPDAEYIITDGSQTETIMEVVKKQVSRIWPSFRLLITKTSSPLGIYDLEPFKR